MVVSVKKNKIKKLKTKRNRRPKPEVKKQIHCTQKTKEEEKKQDMNIKQRPDFQFIPKQTSDNVHITPIFPVNS